MRIVVYVSGHGFGHASRDIELMNALAAREPSADFVVRTPLSTSRFFRARPRVDVLPLDVDTGLAQIDSLRFDEEETAIQAAAFYRTFDRRVADEAATIRSLAADLVVGDIPPLAFAAAAQANVASIAFANFTWDWIYNEYRAFDVHAPDVISTLRHAYASATLALRLPFHGGFASLLDVVQDVPLVARISQRNPKDTRRLLGVDMDRPMVLTSLGGYGASLPLDSLARNGTFTLVTGDSLPDGLVYQDLVAASDVVVSKPGYGIVSECIANNTALLYTSRGRFPEYDLFVNEMPRVLRCRYISQEALRAGQWSEPIRALLAQPRPAESIRVDGADIAAAEILRAAG